MLRKVGCFLFGRGKMKKLFIFISILPIICFTANASYAQYWAKTYGGFATEEAYSIQQTIDGGYVVGGYTSSFGAGEDDIWVLKLDSSGGVIWQKTYGGSGGDKAYSIQQTTDGGYIVAGYTSSFGAGGRDAWVLKLDNGGNIVWQKTYGRSNYDEYIFSIQQTSGGEYIAVGRYFFEWYDAIWVLKLDSNGNISWQKDFGYRVYGKSIQQTSDGGFIVLGCESSDLEDLIVLKLNSDGDASWNFHYNTVDTEFCSASTSSIQQTIDGGYIVVGNCASLLVLKLDSSGKVSWHKKFMDSVYGTSVQQTSDGGYILAGTIYFGYAHDDILVVKLDTNGNIVWQKTYEGGRVERARFIQQTVDGGYVVGGYTSSFGAGEDDIWVLKLDGNGNIPDCNIISTGNAEAFNTSVGDSPSGSNIIGSPPDTILNTKTLPQDSSAEITTICGTDITITTSTGGSDTTSSICQQPCCLEEIYGEFSEKIELLRFIRDNVLTQSPEGQELIRLYYKWSPVIVKAMEEDEEFKEEVKEMVDGVLEMIGGVE
jgi:hypothetical protein